jgi:cation transport ATPase
MDPKGKGKVTNETEEETLNNEPKGEKPVDSGSGKKKRIKKTDYYNNDTSSSSPKDADDSSSKQKTVKTTLGHLLITCVFLTMPMLIYCLLLLANILTLLGSTILGGVIRCTIIYFSLHPRIWNVVENGMHVIDSDDENYNAIHMQEMIHKKYPSHYCASSFSMQV